MTTWSQETCWNSRKKGLPYSGTFPRFADENSLSRSAGVGPAGPGSLGTRQYLTPHYGAALFFAGNAAYL